MYVRKSIFAVKLTSLHTCKLWFINYCQYFTTNLQVILNLNTMSMYILSTVNVMYSLFKVKVHAIYII